MLWEAVSKEPISHWLMLWSSSGIREARKEIGSSSITHRCVVLVFASLFPYLCLLFSAVDVILISLYCLSILFIACVHFSHNLCLS